MNINTQEDLIIQLWIDRCSALPMGEWPIEELRNSLNVTALSENIGRYSVENVSVSKESHEVGEDIVINVETRNWDGTQIIARVHEVRLQNISREKMNQHFGKDLLNRVSEAMQHFTDEEFVLLLDERNKYIRTENTLDGEKHIYYQSRGGIECVLSLH